MNNTTLNEEFTALFGLLETAGWRPQMVDESIPFYEDYVRAGLPTMPGDDYLGGRRVPETVADIHPMFHIRVKGDSMINVGIEDGDILTIMMDNKPSNGDIVLAVLDDEATVKIYYKDEEGVCWLVPQNKEYTPIKLTQECPVRILGKVNEITKKVKHVSSRECQRILNEAKDKREEQLQLTMEQLQAVIRDIAGQVTIGRQWYAVFRPMADDESPLLEKDDYARFCNLVRACVPEHQHLPIAQEMGRMAVLSFAKPVALWDEHDAPVGGKRFLTYKRLGEQVISMMEAQKLSKTL